MRRPRRSAETVSTRADILDDELSRGRRHGIYLRALAAAEALL